MEKKLFEEGKTILGEAKTLRDELENNSTLPEEAHTGMKYAIGYLLDDVYSCFVEVYREQNHNELRTAFEDETLEHGKRTKENIGECNDGRQEYIDSAFNSQFCFDRNDLIPKQIQKFTDIVYFIS